MNMPESKHPGIDALRGLNVRLGELLEYPEPGLITWRQALHETLLEMACYAGVGYAPRHAADLLTELRRCAHTLESCALARSPLTDAEREYLRAIVARARGVMAKAEGNPDA